MEREFEVGFLQQHRAGANDTLASSPQKRENQVIVHFTFGALCGTTSEHAENAMGSKENLIEIAINIKRQVTTGTTLTVTLV